MRTYDFYSDFRSIGERTSSQAQRTSKFSDALQRATKSCTEHVQFVDVIGAEIYMRNFAERKLGFQQCQSSETRKVNLHL